MPRSLVALACIAAFSLACSGSNRSGDGPRIVTNHEVWTPVGAFPAEPVLAPDGAGGMITAWLEVPLGTHPTEIDLRAHRPGRWPAGGVLVATMGGEPAIALPSVQITPDGEGGAIVAWSEYLTTIAVAPSVQRIGAGGMVRWAAGGVPACAGGGAGLSDWRYFSVASDGAGGAVVAWAAATDAGSFVAVQRLAASDGAPLWGDCGTALSFVEPLGGIHTPKLVPDGTGGIIATWWRVADEAIVALRIEAGGGNVLWINPVVLLITSRGDYDAVSDGAGGAIVTGNVIVSAGNFDIIAQRVNSIGTVLWDPWGVTVAAAPGFNAFPRLAADGSGGAVVAWLDDRGSAYDASSVYSSAIYAQRVTGAGAVAWTADGVKVCGKRIPHLLPLTQMIPTGTGGAIVAWADDRDGVEHVFAQRLGADGAAAWAADGMYVANAPGGQGAPVAISDGSGGANLVFTDWRTGKGGVYSQQVAFDGTLP
jgi:hypothetical protein